MSNNKIVVDFTNGKFKTGSGLASSVRWHNDKVMLGLRKIFNCKDNERIVGLEVTDTVIVAYFERT